MLHRAQRNLRGYRTTLLKGEVHELDLPSAGFDKIVCTEVLEHVVNPDAILDQMKRLVRPGGHLVITFPNDALVGRIKGVIRACGLTGLAPFRRIAWGGDEYHLHVWRVAQMRAMLTERFAILRERFAPGRCLPVRCCFLCSTVA
jgi:2-polyprenyl-3-methyl-5-hydroxy-6-metoxy-1,4-benzoquinol methylase